MSSVPESGSSPGEGSGSPLQCSCLEKPMDRGAWRTRARGFTELDTTEWLSGRARQGSDPHLLRCKAILNHWTTREAVRLNLCIQVWQVS